MVSNASDDLPEPDSPVMTVRLFLGISTSMFFRLLALAPQTLIFSSSLFILVIGNNGRVGGMGEKGGYETLSVIIHNS